MSRTLRATFVLSCLLASAPGVAEAQAITYTRGQPVYPAYEGWRHGEDGGYILMFGYMNQNWEQTPHVPVGPDNYFSPGPTDRGQPTLLLPRRNRFIFEVPVPASFGESDELVWTLRANGEETKAYGTIREDLFVDNVVIMSENGSLGAGSSSPQIRANVPPTIVFEGPLERTVRVGEMLTLTAVVTDDGQPDRSTLRSRRATEASDSAAAEEEAEPTPAVLLQRALRASTATVTVSKRIRLHFTWFVYRGEDDGVEIEPPQTKPWEDTRAFANSPWAIRWDPPAIPEDGRWTAEARFMEPGTYVLRGRADDGGLYSDVEVTVHVSPPGV
ncbi:MAG: hypothetical protein FJ207_08140 [Gemmatimonadetes bacterium]|nr:hypothetical protein [Gemmatimonadota bacterium]